MADFSSSQELRKAQKKNFTLIFELSGWVLMTPLCFED